MLFDFISLKSVIGLFKNPRQIKDSGEISKNLHIYSTGRLHYFYTGSAIKSLRRVRGFRGAYLRLGNNWPRIWNESPTQSSVPRCRSTRSVRDLNGVFTGWDTTRSTEWRTKLEAFRGESTSVGLSKWIPMRGCWTWICRQSNRKKVVFLKLLRYV